MIGKLLPFAHLPTNTEFPFLRSCFSIPLYRVVCSTECGGIEQHPQTSTTSILHTIVYIEVCINPDRTHELLNT